MDWKYWCIFLIPNDNVQLLPEQSLANCVCINDKKLLAGTIEPSIQILTKINTNKITKIFEPSINYNHSNLTNVDLQSNISNGVINLMLTK